MAVLTAALLLWACVWSRVEAGLHGESTKPVAVCLTDACVSRGKYILQMMDPRVDPCDDFYQFTCGNFLRTVEIPEDKDFALIIYWMMNYTQSRMVSLLSSPLQANEPRTFRTVKKLYNLCMDEEAMDRRGVKHLLEKLEAAGGWPVLGHWSGDNWSLLETELRLKDFFTKLKTFFDIGFYRHNSTSFVITLDDVSLDRKFLTKGRPDPNNYKELEYMVDVAVLLGADRETAEEQLQEMLYFAIKLAELQKNHYNIEKYTVQNLTETFDWMDWKKLLNSSIGEYVNIEEDQEITLQNAEYIQKLGGLLRNHSNQVIANYMMWRAVESVVDLLTSDLRNLKERRPRWQECLRFFELRFPIALASMFVTSYNETKQILERMSEQLRQELLRAIVEAEWMDDESRLHAEDKTIRMKKRIAYPEELEDTKRVDEYYQKLVVDEEHFLEAVQDVERWSASLWYSKTWDPESYKKDLWMQTAKSVRDVNAFNEIDMNTIEIPAGIMHNPFFDPGVPDYANYAAMGTVVGHEMVHSFDNMGVLVGWGWDEGSEDLEDWWKNETMDIFKARKQCIIDQYSNFTDKRTGLKLNGTKTQGENISDNAGFKLAYRAYKRQARRRKEREPALPGLQRYNEDQLFMLNYAAIWCSKATDEMMEVAMYRDPHSPGEFRVKGVLMNSPDFARAFACKEGTPMNPTHKCAVW